MENRTDYRNSENTAGHIIIKIIHITKNGLIKFIIIKVVSVSIGLYKN